LTSDFLAVCECFYSFNLTLIFDLQRRIFFLSANVFYFEILLAYSLRNVGLISETLKSVENRDAGLINKTLNSDVVKQKTAANTAYNLLLFFCTLTNIPSECSAGNFLLSL
jgi:hypothetical protein